MTMIPSTETATLGGGCFWCVEAVYDILEGVLDVRPGYAGGHVANPTYQQVCDKTTGHAEVVEVVFNPAAITYREILEVFFSAHDPTQLDRQGNDVGPQYRSVIFAHDVEQKRTALEVIAALTADKVFDDPIVTRVEDAPTFWPAEREHLDYFARNPWQPYCAFVVSPKVQKIRAKYAARLKPGV
jgi:peptide-methionine (S)-S-oxide reductase